MQASAIVPLLETVLFLESEAQSVKSLSRILHSSEEEIEDALNFLIERYSSEFYGIEIRETSGGFQFSPKAEYFEKVAQRYGKKNDGRLSRPALETLSIIAYKQPVTKAEIESIRGVPPDSIIRQLLERNLVCEKGKKDVPGRPSLFGTTDEFLRFFKLKSIAELPHLDEDTEERFRLSR